MMKTPPDTLAVHDLSGFGHTSLMVVIPILSRMGVEVTALPTSLLSTNTEFPHYVMQDNTLLMEAILKHWKSLSLSFDAVYTGFLGSTDQVELLIKNIPVLKTTNSIVLVDPVLADWGKLYGCYDLRMVEAMRKLVCKADIITPNLTEAAFLLGYKYPETHEEVDILSWCRKLAAMGPHHVVITSAPGIRTQNELWVPNTVVCYDKSKDSLISTQCRYLPVNYPGTGDCFASLLLGGILNGFSVERSVQGAVDFLSKAIELSMGLVADPKSGIALVAALAENPLDFYS